MRWKALFLFLLLAPLTVMATASEWPREIEHSKAVITLYEPQIEKLTMNDIESRAAVSVTLTGSSEPHFGAVWITARLDVDRDQRIVHFREIKVPTVRFPEATEEQKQALAIILEQELPNWDLVESLDNLIPLLDLAETEAIRDEGFKHEPPNIISVTTPTMLVFIDGEPKLQPVTMPEKSVKKKIERVINTPNLIAYHPKQKSYYLSGGGEIWYSSSDVLGPYSPTHRIPKEIKAMLTEEEENAEGGDGAPPAVMVATSPTELIVTDGKPGYAPLADIDLLYVTNTESVVLVDTTSQKHFVLLSGRWYLSEKSLDGPYSFVDPGQLPESFAKIPADSDIADVLAHVPGTDAAREAMMDNLIPQTAAIDRSDASLKVEYDGQPKFEDVEETTLQYAVNSPQSVFKVGSLYYCCDQGVWYVANAATGPWSVATEVPSVIYDIPPSNPNHNVTYVRVYDVTPTVVYTGYTPGYMGSYAYGGCVVYGTGWYYPGWYGRYYYPRPCTWGFHASYSPWYGWGFGVSYGRGPWSISVGMGGWGHHHHHGWWGPGGYRRPYYPPYRPPYHKPRPPSGTRPPAGGTRPPAVKPGGPGGARPGTPSAVSPRNNIYAKNDNAGRMAKKPATSPSVRPGTAAGKPNNLVTDPKGNVYRSNPSGWDQRKGSSWQPSKAPSGAKTSKQPSARSRGQSRSMSAPPRSAPRSMPSRPSAPRGGGGGRKR